MWNKAIQDLNSESLAVIGVVQEQHAERTRLYKQWKQYEFPIVQDPLTKTGMAVVPLFVAIDEYGIVQSTRFRPGDLKEFVEKKFDAPEVEAPKLDPNINYGVQAKTEGSVVNWALWGDDELLFPKNGESSYNNSISAYQLALKEDPKNGSLMFRLGVAYRKKYDELSHADADFDQASKYWSLALATNPNQYIWRRRIEQYGPRQAKPYPFYDWVAQAIEDIAARGEKPVELTVALTQSELAKPQRRPTFAQGEEHPDPENKINRDEAEYIGIESTAVPGMVSPGAPATVHLRLVPLAGKWNNESTPLTVWLESENALLSKQRLEFENPNKPDSDENRQLEFELQVKKEATECTVAGFALYNVCLENGTCVYVRQDFEIEIPFESNEK